DLAEPIGRGRQVAQVVVDRDPDVEEAEPRVDVDDRLRFVVGLSRAFVTGDYRDRAGGSGCLDEEHLEVDAQDGPGLDGWGVLAADLDRLATSGVVRDQRSRLLTHTRHQPAPGLLDRVTVCVAHWLTSTSSSSKSRLLSVFSVCPHA